MTIEQQIPDKRTSSVSFRFSGKVARLLGEESVSSSLTALSEIVKNAYDADAPNCWITFLRNEQKEWVIDVRDDGIGMTHSDVINKWMVVGTRDKEYNSESKKGRTKVGEKGIGRFAVQRLGRMVEIISRPIGNQEEIRLAIDWDRYAVPEITFDQVYHDIIRTNRTNVDEHGLELVITKLRDNWNSEMLEDLKRQLSTILPPRSDEGEFAITLGAPEMGIPSQRLRSQILEDFLYHMIFEYPGKGLAKYSIQKKGEDPIERTIITRAYSCGPVRLEIYAYILGAGTARRYAPFVLKGSQLKQQLEYYHGLRVYRDGFRVRPYGDPGNDWLGLNIMAHYDIYAFPNDSIIGFIDISRTRNPLVDTTTREGMIQNNAYIDFKNLLNIAIGCLKNKRREDFPSRSTRQSVEDQTFVKLEKAFKKIRAQATDQKTIRVLDRAMSSVRNDISRFETNEITKISMYRGLASLGISVAAVGHEVGDSISAVKNWSERALELLKDRPLDQSEATTMWKETYSEILRVNEFISFVTSFSSSGERTKSAINLNSLILNVFRGYDSILGENHVRPQFKLSESLPSIEGFRVDFESVIVNMITNSIEAFRGMRSKSVNPKIIQASSLRDEKYIILKFSDSGPGIPSKNRELVFEPFWTSKTYQGTGLGLTIVREIISEYGGTVSVVNSELYQGASLEIRIPIGGS